MIPVNHIDPVLFDTEPQDEPRQWQPGRITAEIERIAPGLLREMERRMTLKPPEGYDSWLAYAVKTMDTRSLFLSQIGDTSHWGRSVQRWEMEDAAEKELMEYEKRKSLDSI